MTKKTRFYCGDFVMVEHKILAVLSSFMNHRRMVAEVNHSFCCRQTNIG